MDLVGRLEARPYNGERFFLDLIPGDTKSDLGRSFLPVFVSCVLCCMDYANFDAITSI